MNEFKDCLNYFRLNSGFHRFLNKLKIKYESYGKFVGSITIENVKEYEKQALSGFMKKDYSKNKSITIKINKFCERLKNTKFSNVDLKDILEVYFNEKIVYKKELKSEYIKKKEEEFFEILKEQNNKISYKYMNYILFENKGMNKRAIELYNKDRKLFFNIMTNICNAINTLVTIKNKTKLSVFSANVTKNPHYFDLNTLEGKFLIDALKYYENVKKVHNIEEIASLLYRVNLLIDDVSNMVLCYNLKGYKEGVANKIWMSMCYEKEPIQITLLNLSTIDSVKAINNKVLIVENPNVFTSLISSVEGKNVSIICTYGQIKLSGMHLLDMLKKSNTKMYYSGDIDPEGIIIANKLKKRYETYLDFVGFDKDTYVKNISNKIISDRRLKQLDTITDVNLKEIKLLLNNFKKAAYEELNIEKLKKVLLDFN